MIGHRGCLSRMPRRRRRNRTSPRRSPGRSPPRAQRCRPSNSRRSPPRPASRIAAAAACDVGQRVRPLELAAYARGPAHVACNRAGCRARSGRTSPARSLEALGRDIGRRRAGCAASRRRSPARPRRRRRGWPWLATYASSACPSAAFIAIVFAHLPRAPLRSWSVADAERCRRTGLATTSSSPARTQDARPRAASLVPGGAASRPPGSACGSTRRPTLRSPAAICGGACERTDDALAASVGCSPDLELELLGQVHERSGTLARSARGLPPSSPLRSASPSSRTALELFVAEALIAQPRAEREQIARRVLS